MKKYFYPDTDAHVQKRGNFHFHISIPITLLYYMQIINNVYVLYIVKTEIYQWSDEAKGKLKVDIA